MLRNVLRTDVVEARELLSPALWLQLLLYAGLPIGLLWRVRIVNRRWSRAAWVRAGGIALALAVAVATLIAIFQPVASLMRNHREMRYLITPANLVWSAGAVAMADAKGTVGAGAAFPALAGNPRMGTTSYAAFIIANGKGGMPWFKDSLSKDQARELLTYVRTHFGNNFMEPVTAEDVEAFGRPAPEAIRLAVDG